MVWRVRSTPLQHHQQLFSTFVAGGIGIDDPCTDVDGNPSTVRIELKKLSGAFNYGQPFNDSADQQLVTIEPSLLAHQGKRSWRLDPGFVFCVQIGERALGSNKGFSFTSTSGSFSLLGNVSASKGSITGPDVEQGSGAIPRMGALENEWAMMWLAPGMPSVDVLFDLIAS